MKFLVAASTLAVASATAMEADPDFLAFSSFMEKYNRHYSSQAEVAGRFQIFKDNLRLIEERNNDGGMDQHAVNQFADIHPNEFAAKYLGTRLLGRNLAENQIEYNETQLVAAPKTIDWRAKGAVTPVKNQGQCGSCWAFSTTEQIESDTFLATGKLDVLSPQQIVSCDTVDGGCNGGNPINGYSYVYSAGGIEFDKDYPYTSGTTQADGTCTFNAKFIAANTKPTTYGLVSQSASQESNMYTQILDTPMSVLVQATTWQTYSGGIITSKDGCGTNIDHAVQAVGIGQSGGVTYWIVRNSWSATWGEDGYVYVQTGSNVCGITSQATITNPN